MRHGDLVGIHMVRRIIVVDSEHSFQSSQGVWTMCPHHWPSIDHALRWTRMEVSSTPSYNRTFRVLPPAVGRIVHQGIRQPGVPALVLPPPQTLSQQRFRPQHPPPVPSHAVFEPPAGGRTYVNCGRVSPLIAPATMIPVFVGSGGGPRQFAHDYFRGPLIQTPELVSPPTHETIDPLFLMGGYQPFPQHDRFPISAYTPGDNYYQRLAPTPSTSTEVWMGYSDEASTLGFTSPASLTEGNMVSTLS